MDLPAPATIEGAEHGDHLGVLRLDFGGDNDRLQDISWDERFETFDSRKAELHLPGEEEGRRHVQLLPAGEPEREDA